ncbi:MAG: hypothetical protein U0841_12670 [Chloroflexia bacterium]
MRVFLIGGGLSPRGLRQTLGPFVGAARVGGAARIACVLARSLPQRAAFGFYYSALTTLGAARVVPVYVSRERPLRAADLAGATPGRAGRRRAHPGLPRGAGADGGRVAALVARAKYPLRWLLGRGDDRRRDGDCGRLEGAGGRARSVDRHARGQRGACVSRLPTRLGLVPFLVDVHAAQWGTLGRLLHAVGAGHGAEGWAIDEGTVVEVSDGVATVRGCAAYRARRGDEGLNVEPLTAGASRRFQPPAHA